MSASGRRKVLLIGVGKFHPVPLDAVPSLTQPSYPDLDFAHERVNRLGDVMRDYDKGGYEVTTLLDPTEEKLNAELRAFFREQGSSARIVHVISHGEHDPAQRTRLDMVPACRTTGTFATNVREWVSTAQHPAQTAKTLFLIDLCGSGRVANPEGIDELQDEQIKAWSIAASRADEDALEGHFSDSVIHVLQECSRNGLGTDSSLEFVRFDLLTAQIKDYLVRTHGGHQTMRWTKAEHHAGLALPFFPNPRYKLDHRARQIARLSGPLQPFLQDKVADADHFRLRASDHFTGRRSQLAHLVPWLDNEVGPQLEAAVDRVAAAPGGRGVPLVTPAGLGGALRVVTGKPGTGKSALLGALVCAAHPALIEIMPAVREAMVPCPQPNALLAAVHARQQGLDQIVDSLTVQLGIARDSSAASWTAADLIQAIVALPRQPVVVLDALDECPQFSLVQTLLLLPLANARRPDSSPACRLLVGVRPRWDDFGPLLRAAQAQHGLHDLDETDRDELHDDLRSYALARLGGRPFRDLVAGQIATTLSQARSDWGEFLVAGRYLSYLLTHYPSTAADALAAGDLVPTALPDILERELADHDNPIALRAALTAIAYAKGKGMPESVAREVARVFGGNGDDVLSGPDARLYLRLGIDDDGTSLYRLYHEGLADYLRGLQHNGYAEVFTAVAHTRAAAGTHRTWESAPGYLKRYAIEHAADAAAVDTLLTDAEFLVHADPVTLLRHLDEASTPEGRLAQAVYRSSYHLYQDNPSWRRMVMRLNALRYGATDLARRLGGTP